MVNDSLQNITFAVGTGRCGTKFLCKLLQKESNVASSHEKHPLSDTFHRFCKWYNLPVDHEGFLVEKEKSISEDLKTHAFSFEASAYLSLSIKELYQRFNSKFILLVRRPDRVVNSYLTKGWYAEPVYLKNSNLVPSYQPSKFFHHFLGRTLPRGDEFDYWSKLTRVGRLSWFWKVLNTSVLNQFQEIPDENALIVRLEDLDYHKYREIAAFIGFEPTITVDNFNAIASDKPNSLPHNYKVTDWSDQEFTDFASQVSTLANRFAYPTEREKLAMDQTTTSLN